MTLYAGDRIDNEAVYGQKENMRIGFNEITYAVFIAIWLISSSNASEFKKEWEIQAGQCDNCIQLIDGPRLAYEFAVHKGDLYLTDYINGGLKVFDKNGKFRKKIILPAEPVSISVIGNEIHLLLRNNLLATYDVDRDSISTSRLNLKLNEPQYLSSFLVDNILMVPSNETWAYVKSDAVSINIFKSEKNDTIKGFYDFGKEFDLPSNNTFKHRKSLLTELRGGNERFYLFELFESDNADTSSGYVLFKRKERRIEKIGQVPKEYEDTYSGIGKGVKFYGNKIYTISEVTISNHENIVVGSFVIP